MNRQQQFYKVVANIIISVNTRKSYKDNMINTDFAKSNREKYYSWVVVTFQSLQQQVQQSPHLHSN